LVRIYDMQKKINIAVILEQKVTIGGGFQQELKTATILNKFKSDAFNFVFFTTHKDNLEILKKNNIVASYLHLTFSDKLSVKILKKINKVTKFEKVLAKKNIDLIYFLSPSYLALYVNNYNYIFTVWDLCHRYQLEFPEVRKNFEFEKREHLYKKALPKAMSIIAESEFGKISMIRYYGLDDNRIKILPFLPANFVSITATDYQKNYIDIKNKYKINGDYIFYPAQFWPHKNHIYIINGLKILKEKYNYKINAVFSGSDKGNLAMIMKQAEDLGIQDLEIAYVYKQALALVMPTYFGPTNIPPLEAFYFEIPLLYSDLPDLRAQVENAALFLDLTNPESLAKNLIKVIEKDPEILKNMKEGRKIIDQWHEQDYWQGIIDILNIYSPKSNIK